jgi:hypothetical protein
MRKLLLLIVLIAGCGQKPVEWYPRVTAWRVGQQCQDPGLDNAARLALKEVEFCRPGNGVILSMKGAL